MNELVFLASPLRGATPEIEQSNQKYALHFARRLWEHKQEVAFAPHLYFLQFLEEHEESEREAGIQCGIEILRICKKMYVVGPVISKGMQAEIDMAQELKVPTIYVPDPDAFFVSKQSLVRKADYSAWSLHRLCEMLSSFWP